MWKRATIRLHDKPTLEPYDIHNLRLYDNLSSCSLYIVFSQQPVIKLSQN